MLTTRALLAGGLVAALAVTGCSTSATPSAPSAAVPTATPAAYSFPAAAGKPVLTVVANGKTVEVDFHTLDAVTKTTYDIYEPFDKKNVTFSGMELSAVLDAAGVPASATKVRMTALDEYLVDLDMKDVRAGGVILATRADGAEMSIAKGGPIRIVFEPKSKVGKVTDRWIWSLNRIEVS